MRQRFIFSAAAALLGSLGSAPSGVTYHDVGPAAPMMSRRRRERDAVPNFARDWIRDHMDFCVCRPDRPRRRGAKRRQVKAARKASNVKGGE